MTSHPPSPGMRAERGGRPRGVGTPSELDPRRLPDGRFLDLEIRLLFEVEQAAHDVRRDGLERRVVAQHRVVVDLARDGDLLLRVLELRLQLLEVLRRAQLRVVLRDGEQAPDGRRRKFSASACSGTVRACCAAVRAFVTSSNVARSCEAPFTVSTRFGMRS